MSFSKAEVDSADSDVLDNGGVTSHNNVKIYVDTSLDDPIRNGYWIKSANGNLITIKTSKRIVAQEIVDLYFGKGKYTVNTSR